MTQLKAAFAAAERRRLASLGREEMLKEEGNRLFKVCVRNFDAGFCQSPVRFHSLSEVVARPQAAKFEEAIQKYTEALNAVSDTSSELYLSILNNR
jgi:hypothetical protein